MNKQQPVNMHRDPNNWKWGLFYFNPKDRRLFVPKFNGLGMTLNFGHPFAFIAFPTICGIVLFLCSVK